MPRRRRGRDAEPAGGVAAETEHQFLTAWGLQPAQWRPIGAMGIVRDRACFRWSLDREGSVHDVSLRARRAYDRLGELGTTISAGLTERGIEVTLPLARVEVALRILADLHVMPDAVVLADPPAPQLREVRRAVAALRRDVELVVGEAVDTDPLTALRARVRAS